MDPARAEQRQAKACEMVQEDPRYMQALGALRAEPMSSVQLKDKLGYSLHETKNVLSALHGYKFVEQTGDTTIFGLTHEGRELLRQACVPEHTR